jgi:hypothetical protein
VTSGVLRKYYDPAIFWIAPIALDDAEYLRTALNIRHKFQALGQPERLFPDELAVTRRPCWVWEIRCLPSPARRL